MAQGPTITEQEQRQFLLLEAALKSAQKRDGLEIAGDALREAAVLIVVFVILDPFYGGKQLSPAVHGSALALALACFTLGSLFEYWR